MPGQALTSFVLSIYAAQALAASISAWIFYRYSKRYDRSYLETWSRSWAALAIYDLSAASALILAMWVSPTTPLRPWVSLVSQVAAYLHVVWLLVGAYELTYGRRLGSTLRQGLDHAGRVGCDHRILRDRRFPCPCGSGRAGQGRP